MNAHHTSKRMRSAIAPRMSAGVMMANIAWNMMNTYSGMLRGGVRGGTIAQALDGGRAAPSSAEHPRGVAAVDDGRGGGFFGERGHGRQQHGERGCGERVPARPHAETTNETIHEVLLGRKGGR